MNQKKVIEKRDNSQSKFKRLSTVGNKLIKDKTYDNECDMNCHCREITERYKRLLE